MRTCKARCLEQLRATGAEVAYTEGRIVHEATGRVETRTGVADLDGDPYAMLLQRPPGPVFSCLVTTRKALMRLGGLDESLVAFQEWDTCLRLAAGGARFVRVAEPLFVWHRHGGGTISADAQRNARGYAQVVAKHGRAMRARAGGLTLAAHYSRVAQLLRDAGRPGRAWRYWLKALGAATGEPRALARVAGHVAGQLRGAWPRPLAGQIRVYG